MFTSANAVEHFWRAVVAVGWDARAFKCRIAAIGAATADALKNRSLVADLVAADSSSEGLLEAIEGWIMRSGAPASTGPQGTRFLYPRAADARDVLAEGLRSAGASVDEVLLYEARVPRRIDAEVLDLVRGGRVDAVTFASSSSVRNLATLLGEDFDKLSSAVVACIGPITAATAREFGLRVAVQPDSAGIEALVGALCAHYTSVARP
jgi:uroporphyrinogen-III synthase